MAQVKRINLALQGGGAHGAFTWGVLDRLIEDERIEIAGLSGTSAGALNGAAYKSGWMRDRRDGARETLDQLWARMGGVTDIRLPAWMSGMMQAPFAAQKAMPGAGEIAKALEHSLPYAMADTLSRMSSPYIYGPFYRNPLEQVVDAFDYEGVCASGGPRLFVGATNVRTGKIRIFTRDEITTQAILASACLPTLFQAVTIHDPKTGRDEAYWDGGYTGNPALFPLFASDLPRDIVIVNINPLEREELPMSPQQIHNRINEISFNSSLLRELRAIGFVKRLIAQGAVKDGAMKDVLVHMVADDDLMRSLSVVTKLVPNPVVLTELKEAGRGAADRFIAAHFDDLGQVATVTVADMLD
jgi:NTE family protein